MCPGTKALSTRLGCFPNSTVDAWPLTRSLLVVPECLAREAGDWGVEVTGVSWSCVSLAVASRCVPVGNRDRPPTISVTDLSRMAPDDTRVTGRSKRSKICACSLDCIFICGASQFGTFTSRADMVALGLTLLALKSIASRTFPWLLSGATSAMGGRAAEEDGRGSGSFEAVVGFEIFLAAAN